MNKQDIGGIIVSAVKCIPENNGKVVMNLQIQTQDSFKDKTGKPHSKLNLHNVELWDKSARMVATNYNKGSYIIVSGRSETIIKDGHPITKLIVNSVENFSRKLLG